MQQGRVPLVPSSATLREFPSGANLQTSAVPQGVSFQDHGAAESQVIGYETRRGIMTSASNLEPTSPSEALSGFAEYSRGLDPRSLPRYAGTSSPAMMLNPKRAYRQRRKDPSCDACRERKVKCDATDTTSCTECSSRNVRCQFTKDTNRRMSSIKQVQDLEKQLQDVRQQLERFRASEHYIEQNSPSNVGTLEVSSEIVDVSRSPRRMLKARVPYDLSIVRARLSDVGRGLLRPLVAPLDLTDPDMANQPSISLPSQESAQHYLSMYFECVHRRLPVLLWPEFCSKFWALYSKNEDTTPSKEMLSMCFAVLALGALFSPELATKDLAEQLITTAFSYMDVWNDKTGIDQGLATFLISIYLYEINQKRTSWMWLGSAVQFAQDRGLHVSGGQWSRPTSEFRRRIWYCFYVSERLLATDTNRPMIISDDDCDAEYPENLPEEEAIIDSLHPQKPTILRASIYVARLLQPLAHLCRSLCIPSDSIKNFEMRLATCMQMFPPELKLGLNTPLDPLVMAPLISFQNARIVLHRQNLSPACPPERRSCSIENCTIAAEDTAAVFSRCFEVQAPAEQVKNRLRMAATSLMCTHVWRCLLFLAFCRAWDAFHILVRFASIVADSIPINVSCGRYLSVFLDCLVEKQQQDPLANLEEDAELMVLLSGDLQAGSSSWVWDTKEPALLPSQNSNKALTADVRPKPARLLSWDSSLSDEERRRWGGWTRISQTAHYLEQLCGTQKSQSPGHGVSAAPPPHLQPPPPPPPRTNSAQDPSTAKSRMAIASITDQ